MLQIFRDAATAIEQTLGEPAIYTVAETGATIQTRAVTRRDLQFPISGMDSSTLDRRTVLSIKTDDLAGHVPAIGDTVTVNADGITWKVLALEADNGYIVTVKVRET
ncbi:MAG: hypothetical protein IPN66_06310 [Candidatus Competibacteraceae bacterium]|nr:hypothetical protein [Candidatus Competibacteraceae bacterium]MBK8896596.1 hypothetical protein [Candidatus Competibacteraceae bacterium]MBK8896766.1 hypothetical protein [Candidatus Competibacteraceae bacterium]MBK8896830.1 hypothetical protein [Candidatus Competibacteraceae bacterium]